MFDSSKANIIRAAEIPRVNLDEEAFVLAPRMLPRGGQWLIAGDQEIGKTWLCLNLVRTLVNGEAIFDNPEWTCRKGNRVLFVEPEVGVTMPERMDFVFGQTDTMQHFDYLLPPPGFNIMEGSCRSWMRDQVAAREYDVVIFDSVGRIAHYSENDNSEVARLLENLRIIQGSAALIWTMHFGKKSKDPTQYDPLDIDNIRGASKWADDIELSTTLHRKPGRALKDVEHETWKIGARWSKTRHMRKKPDEGEIIFNAGNDGRMVWMPKEAKTKKVGGESNPPPRTRLF